MFVDHVNNQCIISVICIQESWGYDGIDMSYLLLSNYTMVNEHRTLGPHDGFITYIHDDFAYYRELNNLFLVTVISNVFEYFFIEIWWLMPLASQYLLLVLCSVQA